MKESYTESRATLQDILEFAPSVNCLEDMAAAASKHADAYFEQQEPVDPTTEEQIASRHERLQRRADAKGGRAAEKAG